MKQLFIIVILFMLAFQTKAQDSTRAELEPWMVKMYFLPLTANFEGRIGDSFSVEAGAGIGAGWAIEGDGQFKYVVYPKANLMLKNYYNLDKRLKKGKRTAMNSGNYWGLYSDFAFAPIAENFENGYKWGLVVAPVWGFQRSYPSLITWGFNLGYGINMDNENTRLRPVFNLHLGFILAK
ncbi:hypothetical protein ACFLU5_01420 [Bacteroidota bacterium]